jgi:PAS domain S-box-containing protein
MSEKSKSKSAKQTADQKTEILEQSPGQKSAEPARNPLQSAPECTLQDLIDIEQFQYLQDRLNEIYSFPSAIIDNDGNILTATAWQDVCTKFHRINKECEQDCIKSDQYIQAHLAEANPAVSYRCPHGLVDNATPIIIDGKHYGNFFTGQFFLEKPDLEFFRKQAKKYGFDEKIYLEAVQKVPIWSQQQLESYLFFIKGLIEVISSSGMKKLKEIEARKKIEENEERAGAILSQMLDGFCSTNRKNGRIIDVNHAMCQMLGYTREELLQMSLSDVEANEAPEDIQRRIQQIVRDGSAHFESRHRCKDGSIIDVEISVTYVQSLDMLFGFHRDITERKRAETKLSKQTQRYKLLMETSKDAIHVISRDGKLCEWNGAFLSHLGYTDGEAQTLTAADWDVQWNQDELIHEIDIFIRQNGKFETRHRRKDGTIRDVEINATGFVADGQEFLYASARDITERKQAESALKSSEEKFAKAFRMNPSAIVLARAKDARVVEINDTVTKIFGYSRDEIIGTSTIEKGVWVNPNDRERLMTQLTNGVSLNNVEVLFYTKDKKIITCSSSFEAMEIEGELHTLAVFEDVTERKRSEDALRRLNRELRAISDCNQILVRAEEEQALLNDICRIVCDRAGYRLAWVGYAEHDEAKSVRPVAWAGVDDGYLAAARITWADSERGRGPTGTAIRTGQSVYIQDFGTDASIDLWRENALQRGYRSSIALPLKDENACTFGALMIYSTEPNAFTTDEIRLLEELAGDLAFGLTVLRARGERKRTENALQASEALFRAVVENSHDGIVLVDANSRVLYQTPAMSRISGYTDAERIGEPGIATVHPDDKDFVLQTWMQILQQPELTIQGEYRILNKNGTCHWLETTAQNLLGNSNIKAVVVAARDITERKMAEDALQAAKSKLETMINVSPLAILLVDLKDRIQLWNPAAEKIFGWRADEVLGKPNPIIPASMQDEYALLSTQIFNGTSVTNQETVRQHKGGALIDVSISSASVYDSAGKPAGRMAIINDITERKRAEEQLQILKYSIDTAPDGSYWMDKDGYFLYVNDSGCKALGYTRAEILKMHISEINPLATRQRWAQVWQALKEHGSSTMQSVHRRKDGSEFPVELTSAYGKFGEQEYCNGFAKDITERKQRERELQAIATLSAALRTAPTRAEMLPIIVQQIVILLSCEAVSIEIIDPQTGDAVTEVANGLWSGLAGSHQAKNTGSNAIISQTLKPYHTHDFENDPHVFHHENEHHGIHGSVGFPLIAQEQLIGFVWIGRKADFSEEEVRLLSMIADIAANAIHRTTLHEQTQKDAAELAQAYDTTLEGWAHALELRDQETEGHTRRVMEKTLELARRMGLEKEQLENIRRGALLHDIGKMGIPDSILLKPGELSEREWETMRLHPEYAFNLLHQIEYLRPALDIPYCHHEKWDGSGYPRGLKGEAIPLEARIFAIVDVWDALTSNRPYRPAWSEEDTKKYIHQQSGKHFDPDVATLFFEFLAKLQEK